METGTKLKKCYLTLQIVNDHQNQRIAWQSLLTGVVDVLKLGPMFHKHHKRTHPRVHCQHKLHNNLTVHWKLWESN